MECEVWCFSWYSVQPSVIPDLPARPADRRSVGRDPESKISIPGLGPEQKRFRTTHRGGGRPGSVIPDLLRNLKQAERRRAMSPPSVDNCACLPAGRDCGSTIVDCCVIPDLRILEFGFVWILECEDWCFFWRAVQPSVIPDSVRMDLAPSKNDPAQFVYWKWNSCRVHPRN